MMRSSLSFILEKVKAIEEVIDVGVWSLPSPAQSHCYAKLTQRDRRYSLNFITITPWGVIYIPSVVDIWRVSRRRTL